MKFLEIFGVIFLSTIILRLPELKNIHLLNSEQPKSNKKKDAKNPRTQILIKLIIAPLKSKIIHDHKHLPLRNHIFNNT